eukprot:tig00020704_g13205.t1
MSRALLLAAVVLVISTACSAEWHSCDAPGGKSIVTFKDVVLSPEHVTPGTELRIDVTGTASETITDGIVKTDTYYFKIKLHTEQDKLADVVSQLPISGDFTMTKSAQIPPLAPVGQYTNKIYFMDAQGTQFACVQLTFWITKPAAGWW